MKSLRGAIGSEISSDVGHEVLAMIDRMSKLHQATGQIEFLAAFCHGLVKSAAAIAAGVADLGELEVLIITRAGYDAISDKVRELRSQRVPPKPDR